MALYKSEIEQFGRKWTLEVLGSGTPDEMRIEGINYRWVQSPQGKDPGVFPRQLSIPVFDREGARGFISDRLFNETLDFELSLDDELYFKGKSFSENRQRPVDQAEYDTTITVGDGIEALDRATFPQDTYQLNQFFDSIRTQTGVNIPIRIITDWFHDDIGTPATERLTQQRVKLGDGEKTYLDVLKEFCKDFNFQFFQDEGEWVFRQIDAFTTGDVYTLFISTSSVITSELVDYSETLPVQYDTSNEDILRGVGRSKVSFSWPILSAGVLNGNFDIFDDGEFDAWDMEGTVTQGYSDSEAFSLFDTEGDHLSQQSNSFVKEGDRIFINISGAARYKRLTSRSVFEDPSVGVLGAYRLIFRDGRDNQEYVRSGVVSIQVRPGVEGSERTVNFNSQFFVEINEETSVNPTPDTLPAGFYGKITIEVGFLGFFTISPVDDAELLNVRYFSVGVDVQQGAGRFQRLISEVSAGNLSRVSHNLSISQNNEQFSENLIEYFNGGWLPANSFSGDTFGVKRAKGSLIADNNNKNVLNANGDFSYFSGVNKLYSYDGKNYIVCSADIQIGNDDISLFLVEHTFTEASITENEFFINDGGAVSGISGGSASGGGGVPSGTYFEINNLLGEAPSGDLPTLRSNIGANDAGNLNAGTLPTGRLSGAYTGITGVGTLDAGNISDGFGSIDIGSSALSAGAITGNTLRTDTGKFLSPVNYQMRNAGDTGFRNVEMAGLTATTGVFSGVVSVANASADGHAVNRTTGDGRWANLTGDTFTGKVVVSNSSYQNHLELIRNSLEYQINPSTGSNSGASNELRFESPSNHNRYWFDGVLGAASFNINATEVINSNRDIFNRNQEITGYLRHPDFEPGFTIDGGKHHDLDSAGNAVVNSLFVRGRLTVEELVIKQLSVIGGREILSVASVVVDSVTGAPGAEEISTLNPSGANVTNLRQNDLVVVVKIDVNSQNVVKQEYRTVTQADSGLNEFEVGATTGAPAPDLALEEGDLVVVYGSTSDAERQNIIYRSVLGLPVQRFQSGIDSYAKFDSPADTTDFASGNLNGLYDYSTDIQGVGIGKRTGEHVTVDPTNGLRIKDGSSVAAQLSSNLFQIGSSTRYLRYNTSTGLIDLRTAQGRLEFGGMLIDSTTERFSIDDNAVVIDTTEDFSLDSRTGSDVDYYDVGALFVNEWQSTSEVRTHDITSLVGDDVVEINQINQFIAAREELSFTQNVQFFLHIEGYDGSSWEAITPFREIYALADPIVYPDYGGGTAQDAFSVTYPFEISEYINRGEPAEPIRFMPNDKYESYRIVFENGSFDDDHGIRLFRGNEILQSTQVNANSFFSRDINSAGKMRLYSPGDISTYTQFIVKRADDGSANKNRLQLIAQAVIDGEFAGETQIHQFETDM